VRIEQPAEDATRAIPVEFGGPGTVVLRGQRFGAGERWAVLVHDVGKDLDGWRELAPVLAGHGLSVLAFDLPGHGASDDPWEPPLAVPAVLAAVDFARSHGAQQVHIVGEGVGATAALAAAAGDSRDISSISSIAALSPRADDGVAMAGDGRGALVPKLILVGSLDPAATESAEAVFRAAIGPCEMARFPVAAQGTDLLHGEWGQQAREKVLAHVLRPG
jgi:pimeloyl-ACP methyl ester carboxylesterase